MNDDRYGASKRLYDAMDNDWKIMKIVIGVVIFCAVIAICIVVGLGWLLAKAYL